MADDRPLLYFTIMRLVEGPTKVHQLCADEGALKWHERLFGGKLLLEAIRNLASEIPLGGRQTQIFEKGSEREAIPVPPAMLHAFHHPDGLIACLVSDLKYDTVAAQMIMNKALDEFLGAHPCSAWQSGDATFNAPKFDGQNICTKFKDPSQVNKLAGIQKDLDETMDALRKAIEQTTLRGEQLDSMVQKSQVLSSSSKMFYQQAKKQNSCCTLM